MRNHRWWKYWQRTLVAALACVPTASPHGMFAVHSGDSSSHDRYWGSRFDCAEGPAWPTFCGYTTGAPTAEFTADGRAGLNGDRWICRGQPRGVPNITVTAGGSMTISWVGFAHRPGDCAVYISFDTDDIPDGSKRWAKIFEKRDCLTPDNPLADLTEENGVVQVPGASCNCSAVAACSQCGADGDGVCWSASRQCGQQIAVHSVVLPAWLPASIEDYGRHSATFHYEVTTLEESPARVQLFAGCVDVAVLPSGGSITANQWNDHIEISNLVQLYSAGHLPAVAASFRSLSGGDAANGSLGFPPLATYTPSGGGGSSLETIAPADSSCVIVSQDNCNGDTYWYIILACVILVAVCAIVFVDRFAVTRERSMLLASEFAAGFAG